MDFDFVVYSFGKMEKEKDFLKYPKTLLKKI